MIRADLEIRSALLRINVFLFDQILKVYIMEMLLISTFSIEQYIVFRVRSICELRPKGTLRHLALIYGRFLPIEF